MEITGVRPRRRQMSGSRGVQEVTVLVGQKEAMPLFI